MRRVITLVVIAAISMLVIGCGAKDEAPAPAAGAAGAPAAGKAGGPVAGGAADVQRAPGSTDVTPGSGMGKK